MIRPKVDWVKLKREIHAVAALQRNVGDDHYLSDLSLYATYLYCLASQARGHMHMATWNQVCIRQFDDNRVEVGSNPRSFTMHLSNLEDQATFIKHAAAFIIKRQALIRAYGLKSRFMSLPLNFDLPVVEDSGTTIA